ncbi:hypothetical protein [Aquabacterium sp.]|uniref:hypothetical protein n=1 Tax=Aquabacterium sp. TaxID=1872578 RepID=UPI0035B2E8E1
MTERHPPHSDHADASPHVARWADTLVDLNKRIAMLARLLGAPLVQDADLERLLGAVEAARGFDGTTAQQREHREHDELRGLLALRCTMMAQVIDELGLDLTHQLTQVVGERLQRMGLSPEAYGFLLSDKIDRAVTAGASPAGSPGRPHSS